MKIKSKLYDWETDVPELYRTQFEKTLTFTNISRLRILAYLLIIFNVILICIQQAFINVLDLRHIEQIDLSRALQIAPQITMLRLVFIGLSLIFLVVVGRPTSSEAISRRHFYYESAFILFNLVGFSILSGIIQSAGPGIATSYIMAILVVATFCYLNWAKILLIYSFSWCVMSIMIWKLQADWLIAFSGFLNCSIMTVLALIISRIIYTTRVREFLNQRQTELQKEELAKSNEKLQRLSYLDGLTNIANRRYFDRYLAREWKKAIRQKKLLSLIMIDIDGFKKYNDTYGHLAGDESLTKIATALNHVIKRPSDMIARYGGEEFVVILPDTDLSGACKLANQMLLEVEKLKISQVHSPTGSLTISLGVASIEPKPDILPDSLIVTADRALYKAKNLGGNQYNTLL